MSTQRRLAAILFADIMGYTATMQKDESLAQAWRDRFKSNLDTALKNHAGELIKFNGDGALCCFNSALEASKAALNLQLSMQTLPVIPVRIGLHQGDVVFEDNDVYGDGVNIASRLESMAEPGSILVSGKIVDDVKNHKEIHTTSLGKYLLKNVALPMEIFAVSNPGIVVPQNELAGKAERFVDKAAQQKKLGGLVRLSIGMAGLALLGYTLVYPWWTKRQAKKEWLPAIQKMVSENFLPPIEAFDLALKAEEKIPHDTTLANLWSVVSTTVNMTTQPAGAEIWWKEYDIPTANWKLAGTTPLQNIRFPRSFLRIEIRKKGYQTIEFAGPFVPNGRIWADKPTLVLDPVGVLPENMVRIPSGKANMNIVGLEENAGKTVPAFLMDKFEVSNKAYKAFVDAGGYKNLQFWQYPIQKEGKTISLSLAQSFFVDKTGRPGPANWEAGTYPDGQENHPVTGVSWYEAAAYAAFAKKQLPTVFHWSRVTATARTQNIVALSNFNGRSTTALGSHLGFSAYGVYDLAGNAREWCFNQDLNIRSNHYILGGGWNDPVFSFNDTYLADAFDRSLTNGFRCMKVLTGDSLVTVLQQPIPLSFRDFKKEKPVDDKTFAIYLQQFAYDKKSLNAKTETKLEGETWTAEKISFDAAYNNERMQAWLYLPKGKKGPFQPIVFFPGSGNIYLKTFDPVAQSITIDFLLKGGRAVIYPIYKGTCERSDEFSSDLPNETVYYKDHVIMWRKDLGRSIDYLESRKDMLTQELGYFGWSWGGFMGGILPAIDKRIKAVALHVGGMAFNKALPEVDQINFLPRVVQHTIMINGKHDMFFPVETSQKPMFALLGTTPEKKKIVIYEAGHRVPKVDLTREVLSWFDQYLGPVK